MWQRSRLLGHALVDLLEHGGSTRRGRITCDFLGEEFASEKVASNFLLVLRLPGGSRTRPET